MTQLYTVTLQIFNCIGHMGLSRQLTTSNRMKIMGVATLAGVGFSSITQVLAQEQASTVASIPRVEVLTLGEATMCTNSPTSAIGKSAMGGASLLLLSYLFLGIALLTEKLYEAITVITSRSKTVGLKDSEGKAMQVKVPAWTSTMANLTLLAFASALPEIFLTSVGVFTTPAGSVPSELGPMTLIGSASVNLLIVAAIAVASAPQITAMTQIGTFLLTAVFSSAAYIWLFTILTVTTAGYITLAEALTTLMLYPVLLVLAHAVDMCKKDAEFEDNRRRVCRHALQCMAEEHGSQHVLEQATGFAGEEADQAEASRIQEYFKVCLETQDLSKASLEQLVQIIEEECPVEFLMNRKKAGFIQTKAITKVEDNQEESMDKIEMTSVNLQGASSLEGKGNGSPTTELESNRKTIAYFLQMRNPSYSEQFKLACNSVPSQVHYESSSCFETSVHVISLPWKLIGATIPPTSMFGGWATFLAATVMICCLTFAASLIVITLGCLYNIQPALQGLLIFAAGLSVPKIISAVNCAQSQFNAADSVLLPLASINVASLLLGFGLPYTLLSAYRSSEGSSPLLLGTLETGHIALALASLFAVSAVAYIILGFRRWVEGGELGGHKSLRVGSAAVLILLWIAFISLNGTNSHTFEPAFLDDGIEATQLAAGMIKANQQNNNKVCRARIEFTMNPGLASPFRRYKIQVRDRNGVFQPVSVHCQQYNRQVMCDVPMSILTQAPFNLMDGDVIMVQASALLRTGWSAFSKVSSGNPKVIGPPSAITNLKSTGESKSNEVSLIWDGGIQVPGTTYDIMQSAGPGSPFTRISMSREAKYSVKNLQPGLTYIFRIRTKNQCNFADSEPIRVTTAFQSVTDPQAVRVTSDRCNVRLTWKSPQPGAGQRFYYQIKIQDKLGFIKSFPACGRTFQTSCLFHMQALGNAPTELTPGDAIIAYVNTCDVYTGICSDASPMSNKDVLMSQNPPSKMEVPVHKNKNQKADRFIELTWNHVVKTSDTKARPYVIEKCEGSLETCRSPGAQFREVGRTNDPYWNQKLTPGQYDYAFRVKACTSCGCSLACDPLPVRVEKLCTMPLVRASTSQCGVKFNWVAPNGCGNVLSYSLKVRSAEGKYEDWTKCASDATECTIPYDTLSIVPFNLKTGGQIIAQVQAENVVGWSSPSTSNAVYMADLRCTKPTLKRNDDQSHTEITVTWTRPSRSQKVNLLWDTGVVGGQFIDIPISQSASQYTMKIPPHHTSVDYNFRLDVTCTCNRASQETLPIKLPEKPQAPALACNVQTCKSVDFTWNEPDDGRATIDGYSLSIKALNGQLYPVRKCGQNAYDKKCSLTMNELMAAPYNLKVADKIEAKIFASNKVGEGDEARNQACTGTVKEVWVLPCKPSKPELLLDDEETKQMTVKWDGCPETKKMTYKLYFDQGKDNFKLITETQLKKEYTFDTKGIDSRFFKIYLEAINPCGKHRSEILVHERKAKPLPIQSITVEGTCEVTITVKDPSDNGGFPIISGKWEILNTNGIWSEYTPCGTGSIIQGNQRLCKFPMRSLAKQPFNLHAGDDVHVRACLASKLGCGEYVEATGTKPIMYQIAKKLDTPTLIEKPDERSIQINWIGCTEDKCNNELEIGEVGKQRQSVLLPSTNEITYTKKNLIPGVEYDFCVGTKHSCDTIEWSCEQGKILVKPDPPKCSRASGKCEAVLAWTPPRENGGTDIIQYIVDVQTRDSNGMGNYIQVQNCGRDDTNSCTITMKDLALPDYNLWPGDMIKYKIRAVNGVGHSDESEECQCVKQKETNPPTPAAPTASNKSEVGFDVRFSTQYQNEELYCDNGDGVTYSKMITSPGMNFYRMAITPAVKEYKCWVQATNECGGLGKSSILMIDVTKPPGCPILRVSGQCSSQKIDWTPPTSDGGKPIEGYKFEIQTHRKFANGHRMWNEYAQCGSTSPCMISMEDLNMPPFSILNGESVEVRASARNANGYGNTCGSNQKILMAKKPPKIWLTAAKENNQIKACWNSPFRAASVLGHKFTLNWGSSERDANSVEPLNGMDKSIETTQTCHTIMVGPGASLYRFVVRAGNICGPGEYSPEVRVEVAVCKGEACHHQVPQQNQQKEIQQPVAPLPPVVPAPVENSWVPAQPAQPAQPVIPYYQPTPQPAVWGAVPVQQNGWQCPAPVIPPQPTIIRQQSVMRTSWCPVGLNGAPLLAAEPDTTYELYYASGQSDNFAPLAEGPTCEYSMQEQKGQNMKFKVRAKRNCGAVSEWSDVTYDSGLPQKFEHVNEYHQPETSWQTVNKPIQHSSNAWTHTQEAPPAPVVEEPTTPSSPNNAWTSTQPVQPPTEFGQGPETVEPNAWQMATQAPPHEVIPAPSGSTWQHNPTAIDNQNGAQWNQPKATEAPQPEPVAPAPVDGAQWATNTPTEQQWQSPSLPSAQGWQSTGTTPTPSHIISQPVNPVSAAAPATPETKASGKQVRTSPAYGTCGAVMIEWDRISNAGSPIFQQKVEVKGYDGKFYSANLGCGTRTSMNLCVVSSSTLMKAPYNLQAGDLVVARVSVQFSQWTVSIAENTVGAHLTSAKVPDAMQAPIVRKNPDNSFSISWHANLNIPQEYELVWDAGKSWLPVDQLVTKTSATSFNTQAVVPRNAYRFAVRASNQCGTGPYSSPVSIFVP